MASWANVQHIVPCATPLFAMIVDIGGFAGHFPVQAIVHMRDSVENTISSLILRNGDYYIAEENSGFAGIVSDWTSAEANELSRNRIRFLRMVQVCDKVSGRLEHEKLGRHQGDFIHDQVVDHNVVPMNEDPRNYEKEIYDFIIADFVLAPAPTVGE